MEITANNKQYGDKAETLGQKSKD